MTAPRVGLLAGLALRDLRHGWRSASCLAVAVGVALIPLLLLMGLKAGIVDSLVEELRGDPRILEVRLTRDAPLPPDLPDALRNDPRVGFVLPRALYLSSSVRMRGPDRDQLEPRMVPTAPGDPYFEGQTLPTGLGEVALSARAAADAGAATGDEVTLEIARTAGERRDRLPSHTARVVAVLPAGRPGGDDIFAAPELEWAIDRWKQDAGFATLADVPPIPQDRPVSNLRLFAADVRDVPALRDALLARGLAVETRASEVERVLALESGLTWVFLAVSVLSAAGFLLTMGLHLVAAVVEKARELSVLRLLGMRRLEVGLMPSMQGAAIGAVGASCACVLALLAQPVVNASLAGLGGLSGDVSRLRPLHLGAAVLAALAAGGLAGIMAGLRAGGLEPAEGLRRD